MQKKVMNGSVVPLLDKPKHDKICGELNEWVDKFYNGDKLTPLELDIEQQYVSQKFAKQAGYTNKKTMANKTVWTISDLNRH